MELLPRTLVLLGAALLAAGLLLHLAPQIPWLGRLPGDLHIERPGFRLYVPLATCLLASVVFSLLFWIVSRLR